MIQKGLAPILIVLLLALALGGYLVYQRQTKSNPVASPAPTTAGETANWKTYANQKYHFQINYPNSNNWHLGAYIENNSHPEIFIENDRGTHMGLLLPGNPDANNLNVNIIKQEPISVGTKQILFNYFITTSFPHLSAYTYLDQSNDTQSVKTIVFYLSKTDEERDLAIIKQILSTFKFTN